MSTQPVAYGEGVLEGAVGRLLSSSDRPTRPVEAQGESRTHYAAAQQARLSPALASIAGKSALESVHTHFRSLKFYASQQTRFR
jgi:hypothetical protein